MQGVRIPKIKIVIPERVAERAATRVEVNPEGCWISTYSIASHGYAQIGWTDKDYRQVVTAHRAAWTYFHGQIPPGMTVDHICRVRPCVNPDHLQLLTNLENARGGGGLHLAPPSPTDEVCHRGHVVLLYHSGAKHCRECAQEWRRRKRKRQQLSRSGIAA